MQWVRCLLVVVCLLGPFWWPEPGTAATSRPNAYVAQVEVSATGGWQDTGIDICPDAGWNIVALGMVTGWADANRGWAGPGGMGTYSPFDWGDGLVASAPLLSLVGRIGTVDWYLGGLAGVNGSISAGRLYLAVNDAQPWDNAGYFIVYLTCAQGDCACAGSAAAPAADQGGPSFQLGPTFPNPMGTSTDFVVETERPGVYRVSIYDASGRLVRQVHDGELSPGSHRFQWNGTDDGGKRVTSGVYFCGTSGPGGELARKMLVLE